MQKLSCQPSHYSIKDVRVMKANILRKINLMFLTYASFLLKPLKPLLFFILDRDFPSTLVIVGLFSILLHILLDLHAGLYVSIALLSIYLILAMFFLISLIRNYGLQIDIEATVNTGIIFSVAAWVFLTLIYLVI